MAVRVLLVLVALAVLCGCGQSGSAPDQGQKNGEVESESSTNSSTPSGSTQRLKSTTPVGSGQNLVFGVSGVSGEAVYAMDPAEPKPTRLTDGDSPAWSPDGKRIAYTRYLKEPNPSPPSGSAEPIPFVETPYIFVMNTDGSGGKRLLGKAAVEPEWSPDGKEIAFALYTPNKRYKDIGYSYCGIYVVDADGSGTPRKLATGPGCASSPAWSPDGTEIAYTNGLGPDEGGSTDMSEVYVADAPGEEDGTAQPRPLTDSAPGKAFEPEWSPDGTEIAFHYEGVNMDTLKGGVYKMKADGSNETPLALTQDMNPKESVEVFDYYGTPTWSPDGDRIAYVRFVPLCDPDCSDGSTLEPREISIMNSDGSNPRLVRDFGTEHAVLGLDWRPMP